VRSGSRFWFTSIYCSQLEALCYWLLCSTIKAHFGSCSTLNNFLASQEHKTQTWGFGHNTLWHCHKCCDYFISIPMKSSYTYPFFVSCLLYNTWGYYAMLKHGHMKRADPSRKSHACCQLDGHAGTLCKSGQLHIARRPWCICISLILSAIYINAYSFWTCSSHVDCYDSIHSKQDIAYTD
jgi:hypothetical protein